MDAEARARELLDGGATIEQAISGLREAGFGRMESAAALIEATQMSHSEVVRAVFHSPVWADAMGWTDDWIDPLELPDPAALARLREFCAAEPRIAEAWIRGSRFLGYDGRLSDRTAIAFVFDPPVADDSESSLAEDSGYLQGLVRQVNQLWPLTPGGGRSYHPVTKDILDAHAEHCIEAFRREASS
jgi:hypothetical protein